jgi:hypothetical protein
MKPVFLFDIDHTLYNTELLKQSLPPDYRTTWQSLNLPYAACVYPEVPERLRMLSKSFSLGVFSISDVDGFQDAKLEQGGIKEYFDTELVFIQPEIASLIESIAETAPNVRYIIDDRLDKLAAVRDVYPHIALIHIKRGKYTDQEYEFTPDHEVETLDEMMKIVSHVGNFP